MKLKSDEWTHNSAKIRSGSIALYNLNRSTSIEKLTKHYWTPRQYQLHLVHRLDTWQSQDLRLAEWAFKKKKKEIQEKIERPANGPGKRSASAKEVHQHRFRHEVQAFVQEFSGGVLFHYPLVQVRWYHSLSPGLRTANPHTIIWGHFEPVSSRTVIGYMHSLLSLTLMILSSVVFSVMKTERITGFQLKESNANGLSRIILIPKTIGSRKRDCAWGCARGINTTWENLQIEKHKSVRWVERTPSWFVLFDLQIFSGGVYPPSATSRTISFSISNSFWY